MTFMLRGDRSYIAFAAGIAAVVGTIAATAVASNLGIVAAAVVGTVVLWWFASLDWWQRFYALTLTLMVGATSTIAPLVTLSEYGRYTAAGGLFLVTWLSTRAVAPDCSSIIKRRVLGALWFTVILAGASTIWSESRSLTALQTVALVFLVGVVHLLATRRWTDREVLVADLTAGTTVLTAAFLASLGTLMIGYPASHSVIGHRFQGIFNNPNLLGMLAAVTIPVLWGLFQERRNPVRFIMIAPAVAVLLLSESRTAIGAVAVSILYLVLSASTSARITAVGAALLGSVIVIYASMNPFGPILDRFGSVEGGGRFNGRVLAWKETVDLLIQQPIGYGWQAGRHLFESLQGAAGFSFTRTSVHNSYLQFLLELGLIALIPLITIVAALVLVAVRASTRKLSAGLVGTIIVGCLVQVTESAMFGTGQPYPYVFWFTIAGALAIYEPKQRAQKAEPEIRSASFAHFSLSRE
jgi:exopolysaccharide production protein ExoQ